LRCSSSKEAAAVARPRLAAFDLDGTLLGPDLTLHETVVRALKDLGLAGVAVIIVTGRMHRTAERYARLLGLEGAPLVSYNGAMARVVGSGETWWHEPIEPGRALEVVSFLAERGLEPVVFSSDTIYASRPSERLARYLEISGVEPVFVDDLGRLMEEAPGKAPLAPTKLLQVEDSDLMPALHEAASERFRGVLNVSTSYPFFLEFMAGNVNKAWALARLAGRLGVGRRETMAFGDGLNDLELIRWAGVGVAMGHGPPALLEEADHVIDGPPGEGVARFIHERLPMWTTTDVTAGGR